MRIFSFYYFNLYRYFEESYPDEDPHKTVVSDIWVSLGIFLSVLLLILYLHFSDIPQHMLESESGKVGNKYQPSPLMLLMFVPAIFLRKFINWFFGRPSYIEKLKKYYLPNGDKTPSYRGLGIFLTIFFWMYPLNNLVFYFWYGDYGLLPLLFFFIAIEIWIQYTFKWKLNRT